MTKATRYKQAKTITVIGAMFNALLGLIKLWGGFLFHSHALIADALHSFSDLLTDAMVIFASKYGSQDADSEHPYGHKRIETAATFLLALLLLCAGIGILWDAVSELFQKQPQQPGVLTIPIAALSILINEALFHYTHRVGKQIHSDLIIANAWHHRSDAASSIVVLVGLIGSRVGWAGFDALAAIIVGGLVIQMALSYGYNSIKELVDTAVEPNLLVQIEQSIQRMDGVQTIHQLRTRMMGGDIFVDVHILVLPGISVSEGHFIAQHVHTALIKEFHRIKDVTVHVDPEDDEAASPSFYLPSRKALVHRFLNQWQQDYPCIQSWILHYLNGKIYIDLICDPVIPEKAALCERIQRELMQQSHIANVRLLSQIETLGILHSDFI